MEMEVSMPHSLDPILSRTNSISRISTYFLKIHFIIDLPAALGFLKYLFSAGLPVKILKAFPPSILAKWPVHLNLLDLVTLTILSKRYKLWSSSLWSLLHSPFAFLLSPNIRLRILFSNTLSLHVRDHASNPYSTTGRVLIFHEKVTRKWNWKKSWHKAQWVVCKGICT